MAIQDSGSNYEFFDKHVEAKVNSSNFNLSHLNSFNADFGQLIPFFFQETLPKSVHRLSNQILAYSNPMVSRLLSRVRIFTHYFWLSYAEMWHMWHAFLKKGNDGDTAVQLPYVHPYSNDGNTLQTGVDSLWNKLGLPINADTDKVEAFIFYMYQSIYKHYYLPFNILSSDEKKKWFTLDETKWTLKSGVQSYLPTDSETETDAVNLTTLRYRNFIDDYFTSALLNPQRGSAPTITFNGPITGLSASGNVSIPALTGSGSASVSLSGLRPSSGSVWPAAIALNATPLGTLNLLPSTYLTGHVGDTPNRFQYMGVSSSDTQLTMGDWAFGIKMPSLPDYSGSGTGTASVNIAPHTGTASQLPVTGNASVASTLNADAIRQLFTTQLELERMARTDGSYREFMQAFFGEIPKNANDHRPQYIGGTVQNLAVSEVLSTAETESDPLGAQAGHGVSAADGEVGTFYADDYGMIMGIMSIMPDTYYAQGIPHWMTRTTQEDFFIPNRDKLGMEAILNQEIFWQNNNDGTGRTENQGLFGWQDRYDYYRYRANYVSGKMADSGNSFWNTMVQTRFFSTLPTLTHSFVTTKNNVNMNAWYAKDLESPFIVQVANRDYASLPLPYRSIPAGLGVA